MRRSPFWYCCLRRRQISTAIKAPTIAATGIAIAKPILRAVFRDAGATTEEVEIAETADVVLLGVKALFVVYVLDTSDIVGAVILSPDPTLETPGVLGCA